MELLLTAAFIIIFKLRADSVLIALLTLIVVIFCFRKKSTYLLLFIANFLILNEIINIAILKNLAKDIHLALHYNFSNYVLRNFTETYTAFIISITIGATGLKLPSNIYESFKKLNLLHAISISGANFLLIRSIFIHLNHHLNNRITNIFILTIQTTYMLLIGLDNLPALRAYIFSLISTYSVISGRPIVFKNKILLTIILVTLVKSNEIFSLSFLLSLGFSIFYKLLETKPLNRIFNSEIKKLTLTFIISIMIFNSDSPDFIANIVFSVLYPLIFILIFTDYFLHSLLIIQLTELVSLLVNIIFHVFNNLRSSILINLQILIFLFALTKTIKDTYRLKDEIYEKFAQ